MCHYLLEVYFGMSSSMRVKRREIIMKASVAILVLTVLLAGCAGFMATPTPTSDSGVLPTATPTHAPTHGVTPTATPTPTLAATPTPAPAEEFSFFEEELIGLWSRYHRYDDTRQYVRFNDDGTACKWEQVGGSSRRKKQSFYSDWEIDEANPIRENRFSVLVQGAGLTYTFATPQTGFGLQVSAI
jgi:hypothetical protein